MKRKTILALIGIGLGGCTLALAHYIQCRKSDEEIAELNKDIKRYLDEWSEPGDLAIKRMNELAEEERRDIEKVRARLKELQEKELD